MVGAGATVSAVLKELKKHGLTLQNFSSIQEQQIGGWTQVLAPPSQIYHIPVKCISPCQSNRWMDTGTRPFPVKHHPNPVKYISPQSNPMASKSSTARRAYHLNVTQTNVTSDLTSP